MNKLIGVLKKIKPYVLGIILLLSLFHFYLYFISAEYNRYYSLVGLFKDPVVLKDHSYIITYLNGIFLYAIMVIFLSNFFKKSKILIVPLLSLLLFVILVPITYAVFGPSIEMSSLGGAVISGLLWPVDIIFSLIWPILVYRKNYKF